MHAFEVGGRGLGRLHAAKIGSSVVDGSAGCGQPFGPFRVVSERHVSIERDVVHEQGILFAQLETDHPRMLPNLAPRW
jgi:hypothetical protein